MRAHSDDDTPVPIHAGSGGGEATTGRGGTADMFVRPHAPDVEPARIEGHSGKAAGGEEESCVYHTPQVSNHSPLVHSQMEDSATDEQAAPPSPERTPSYWMVFMCTCI